MASEMSEAEDEVRVALENSLSEARAILRDLPPTDAKVREIRRLATRAIADIPRALEAAERGDVWASVSLALHVGLLEGLLQSRFHEYPREQKQRSRGTQLGRQNAGRRKVAGEDILEAYRRLRAQHPKRSRTDICARAGEELQLSASTIRQRLIELGEIAAAR